MPNENIDALILAAQPIVRDWRVAHQTLAALECGQTSLGEQRPVEWGKVLVESLEKRNDVFVEALCRRLRRLARPAAERISAEIEPYVRRPESELRSLISTGERTLLELLDACSNAGLLRLDGYVDQDANQEDFTSEEGLVDALVFCDLFDPSVSPFASFVRKRMMDAFKRLRGERQWKRHVPLASARVGEKGSTKKGAILEETLVSNSGKRGRRRDNNGGAHALISTDHVEALRKVEAAEKLDSVAVLFNSILGRATDADRRALSSYFESIGVGDPLKLDALLKRALLLSVGDSAVRRVEDNLVAISPRTSDPLMRRRLWLLRDEEISLTQKGT